MLNYADSYQGCGNAGEAKESSTTRKRCLAA
jgi:hypothetical protein